MAPQQIDQPQVKFGVRELKYQNIKHHSFRKIQYSWYTAAELAIESISLFVEKTNLGLDAGPCLTDLAGGWREPDLQLQTAGGTTENKAFSFCVHAGSHQPSSTSSTA